jgi:xanthine dehydrogenase accessory factor
METEMDIYEAIEGYLSKGRGGVIATIAKKLGAAPREAGAKMFIGDDGRLFGTIGGGCVEAEVWQEAKRIAGTQNVKLFRYQMDGKIVEDEGMICGGRVDVLLEPVEGRYRSLYDEVRGLEKSGKNALIVTRYTEGSFSKSLVLEDGSVVGDELEEALKASFHSQIDMRGPATGDGMLIEPIASSSFLYLFGAGHVSQYVSRIASMVDFNVVVVDDRADFANAERFPEAIETIVGDFGDVCHRLDFCGNEYVAILTRGHKHDATVLEEIMKKPTRYVGMIGSRRKTKLVFDHLRVNGFEEAALQTIHAPIGLEIRAETPQEIAVSIVAELIEARRKA